MRRNTTIRALAVVAAAGLGLTACTSSDTKPSASSSPTVRTLVVQDKPLPSFTNDFNPLDSNSFGSNENGNSLIYEPLFMFNSLKSDQAPIPWLAKSFAWSNGNRTLTLALRHGVKWSDGQAFTSADVKFTFELLRRTPAANTGGVPAITSMTTPDANTLVMKFASSQSANLVAIGNQIILPQHLWVNNIYPTTSVISGTKAIGTGPYLVDKAGSQEVTFKVNPNYWGGSPKVKRISFPAYANNDAVEQALASGKIDLTGNDINNVQKAFVAKDPAHNHLFRPDAPYFPAGNTVSLLLNNNSKNAPALADVNVRKAISAALDRRSMATKCETNYELPASSSGGLTLPIDQGLLSAAQTNDLKPAPDTAAVSSLMTTAGYTKSGGRWTKGGKSVKFTIIDPNSFSDYWCDAQAMVRDLNAQGFDVSANGAFDFNSWNATIANGKFDAAVHWGQGVTTFQRLQFILDPNTTAAIGQTAAGDYDRYDSAKARAAVATFQNATTPTSQKNALNTLQQIMSDDVPAVPVLYGAAWYEYSTARFTGWPTSTNAYINPTPNSQAYEYMILHLTPVP